MTPPSEIFVVDVPIPILKGDILTMIGFGNDTVVNWEFLENGSGITVDIPSSLTKAGKYCWVIKINYKA